MNKMTNGLIWCQFCALSISETADLLIFALCTKWGKNLVCRLYTKWCKKEKKRETKQFVAVLWADLGADTN